MGKPQVIAVTLNPALDVTLWAKRLDFDEPVKAISETVYPGGKAVNIACVLHSLGTECQLLGVACRNNLASMEQLLQQKGVSYQFVSPPGSIRENLTLCLEDGKVLKVNRTGEKIAPEVLDQVCQMIRKNLKSPQDILAFSGGKPPNLSVEQYFQMVRSFHDLPNPITLDNDLFSLEMVTQIHPFVIKPNYVEFLHLTGYSSLEGDELLCQIARVVNCTDHLLLSMGADGGYYANQSGIWKITTPSVPVKSTVGAGDTSLACFLTAILQGKRPEQAALWAFAGGTASVQLDGTGTITPEQWQKAATQTRCDQFDQI
ncbi:1-phosphofructokinase family hexose kinase [Clostridium facile]|uniref:Tagatose-6-phosphate kinase n=1 Tax=Clostridium facile TaxID=2763035 RepID=A0ABR7ITC9_9CLOT|nr:PfkB family carbohydrate kinase [Clostridium facile]MBC5788393.1 hypothetical protein [Clostridium facile]